MEVNGQLHAPVRTGEEEKNLLPLLGCKPQIVHPEAYSLHRLRYPVPPQKLSIVQHKIALFFVLWGPPALYKFKVFPRSEFENFC
jgi:hypothetical protein